MIITANVPLLPLGREESLVRTLQEEAAVGKLRQRVVQRLVLVLLGLTLQLRRRSSHQPEQDRVEERESHQQDQVELVVVLPDQLGDRIERQIDLDDAGCLAIDLQRNQNVEVTGLAL